MRPLVIASKKGEFLVPSQFSGTWVKAGDTDFQDDKDQVYAAIYLEAFQSLCKRSYNTYEGGISFVFTSSGFKKARELAKD